MGNPYYANPDPVFQPSMRIVQAITTANPASVTTTFDHDYITGTVVRLDIPAGFGMKQMNQKTGAITVTGLTTFNIDIDSTLFEALLVFASWPSRAASFPHVVAIGSENDTLKPAVVNSLPY